MSSTWSCAGRCRLDLRHGRVLRTIHGEPELHYYAEFEFPDMDAFKAVADSPEFRATGKDAAGWATRTRSIWSGLSDRATSPPVPRRARFESIVFKKAPRATITLNRPDVLNAFDFRMLRELARACEDASWDDEIRVVVLTGAGRAFCVGANLRDWVDEGSSVTRARTGSGSARWTQASLRPAHRQADGRGINGICVGGGNELQMACDLAVMVEDAFIRHVGLQHGPCRRQARPNGLRSSSATVAPARSSCSAMSSLPRRRPNGVS